MSNIFSEIVDALESLFRIGRDLPHVVATGVDAAVQDVAPIIDDVGGAGSAQEAVATIDGTAKVVADFLGPKLKVGEDVAHVASTVLKLGIAGATVAVAQGTSSAAGAAQAQQQDEAQQGTGDQPQS